MADISSIILPGGGTYDLKDKNAVPKYGMGKNLLDNAYFVGGGSQLGDGIFPINQRGQTQYSGSGKHFDRWGFGIAGGALELLASGIKITVTSGSQSFAQTLSTSNASLYGRTVTVSALTAGGDLYYKTGKLPNSAPSSTTTYISKAIPNVGNLSVVYAASTGRFNVNITNSSSSSQSVTIAAMKLEFGSEQTLAHQENGTWVLNEIPDYEEELIKCQTSTADSTDTYANKSLATEQQLAHVQTTNAADHNYKVGEYFCYVGNLYRTTTAVATGVTLANGTNCTRVMVGEGLVSTRSVTATTTNTGRLSTGLQTENAIVLAAYANGYFCSVYVNNNVQGIEVRNLSGAVVANTSVTVTLVVLYV